MRDVIGKRMVQHPEAIIADIAGMRYGAPPMKPTRRHAGRKAHPLVSSTMEFVDHFQKPDRRLIGIRLGHCLGRIANRNLVRLVTAPTPQPNRSKPTSAALISKIQTKRPASLPAFSNLFRRVWRGACREEGRELLPDVGLVGAGEISTAVASGAAAAGAAFAGFARGGLFFF